MIHKAIQVVDRNGEPVGVEQSPFSAIQNDKIRLLVRVVVYNKDGHVLLQKRADGLRMYPGCWDVTASGHVDEGESADEAAARELREELGITLALRRQTSYYDELYVAKHNRYFRSYSYVFNGEYSANADGILVHEDEVSEVRWYTKAEVRRLVERHYDLCTDGLVHAVKEGWL